MSDKIEACECGKAILPSHAPSVDYVPDWVIEQSASGMRYGCYVECALCGWRSSYHYDDDTSKAHDAAISAWNSVMRAMRIIPKLRQALDAAQKLRVHCGYDSLVWAAKYGPDADPRAMLEDFTAAYDAAYKEAQNE